MLAPILRCCTCSLLAHRALRPFLSGVRDEGHPLVEQHGKHKSARVRTDLCTELEDL